MNKPKIVVDPAFFENFDGSQEELDQMMEEIMQMFEGKTSEEIQAMSQPVDWDELEPEEAEKLINALDSAVGGNKRYLQ